MPSIIWNPMCSAAVQTYISIHTTYVFENVISSSVCDAFKSNWRSNASCCRLCCCVTNWLWEIIMLVFEKLRGVPNERPSPKIQWQGSQGSQVCLHRTREWKPMSTALCTLALNLCSETISGEFNCLPGKSCGNCSSLCGFMVSLLFVY